MKNSLRVLTQILGNYYLPDGINLCELLFITQVYYDPDSRVFLRKFILWKLFGHFKFGGTGAEEGCRAQILTCVLLFEDDQLIPTLKVQFLW